MKTLTFHPGAKLNESLISQAVEALRGGHTIIYPTDTVYAIGCDALNQRAIERVCRIKGINPERSHLSILCSDISQAAEYVRIDNRAFAILRQYLPGPYTFILPTSTRLPKAFKGRREAGVRIPDCEIARALAHGLGNPLLTTTVEWNEDAPEEAVEPWCIADRYNGEVDLMLECGEGTDNPSTVVDLTDSSEPAIVRQGIYPFEL